MCFPPNEVNDGVLLWKFLLRPGSAISFPGVSQTRQSGGFLFLSLLVLYLKCIFSSSKAISNHFLHGHHVWRCQRGWNRQFVLRAFQPASPQRKAWAGQRVDPAGRCGQNHTVLSVWRRLAVIRLFKISVLFNQSHDSLTLYSIRNYVRGKLSKISV